MSTTPSCERDACCRVDADCDTLRFCSFANSSSGVGQCAHRGGQNAPCTRDASCFDDYICHHDGSPDSNAFCKKKNGENCTRESASDCASGICIDFDDALLCHPNLREIGETCTDNIECDTGYCADTTEGRFCLVPQGAGCDRDSDCGELHRCEQQCSMFFDCDSVCVPKLDRGQSGCGSDDDCLQVNQALRCDPYWGDGQTGTCLEAPFTQCLADGTLACAGFRLDNSDPNIPSVSCVAIEGNGNAGICLPDGTTADSIPCRAHDDCPQLPNGRLDFCDKLNRHCDDGRFTQGCLGPDDCDKTGWVCSAQSRACEGLVGTPGCEHDHECTTGAYCAQLTDTETECQSLHRLGEACFADNECAEGECFEQVCTLPGTAVDHPCADNRGCSDLHELTCVSATCQLLGAQGDSCDDGDNEDCRANHLCLDLTCHAQGNEVGAACHAQLPCAGELVCDGSNGCRQRGSVRSGAPCQVDEVCMNDHCRDGGCL